MARKETMDRPLFARMQTQFQTTDLDSLLQSPSADLLSYIRKVPLTYGFWGDFKRLVKAAEKSADTELIAALLARLDTADLPRHSQYLPDSPLPGDVNGVGRMVFDGQYAHLVIGDYRGSGVNIVDMSLPAAPTITANIRLPGVTDLAVLGTKMLLLQGTSWNVPGRLSCYDISDPAHPKPESGIALADGVGIGTSGSTIAVLTTERRRVGLQLIDASQPGQLRLLGHLPLARPLAMQIDGQRAFILTTGSNRDAGALVIVDISQPLKPRKIHELAIAAATDIAVQGRYAYLTCTQGHYSAPNIQNGLAVVDLAPPDFARARQISTLPLGNAQNLVVQGRYAYVSLGYTRYGAIGTGGLRIVDIADPAHPQLVGSLIANQSGPLAIVGDVLCFNVTNDWNDRFRPLNVAEPARPLLLGSSPGRETLAYMKRRGRRFLHTLALRDPKEYVQTAAQMLLEAGQVHPELDPRTQWISIDLLYGGGTRYEQRAHGRGSYGAPRPGLSLRTREERFPELWDRAPELAIPLYTTPKLPWQTWETACKILRSTQTSLPLLNDRMLGQFVATPSPLLRSVACRQVVATLEAGRSIAADVAADAYLIGTHRQREAIGRYLAQQTGEARWSTAFATRLYQIADETVIGPQLSRKVTLAFALLISGFPALFSRDLKPQTVVALYNTGRPDFGAWAMDVLRSVLPMQLPQWLAALESLPEETREAGVLAVAAGFEAKEIPRQTLNTLLQDPSAWIRQAFWKILAQSATPFAEIASLWGTLLNSHEPTPALLTAFASPDALALFARCDFDSSYMANLLESLPFLIPLMPTAVLEKVVAVLPPGAVMNLVAEASEEQWSELKTAILLGPLLPEHRVAFWQEAFAVIGATGNLNLTQRLLGDLRMQAAFAQLADISEYLRSANPVFGPLLGRWVATHSDLLRRDAADLLQIATHPLPEIRTVGLNRVREVGMSLPFALRLLESEVPPSVVVGKTFFIQLSEDDDRTEAITALCDSPKPSVRAFGREVLTGRPDILVDTDILDRLSENPDPETQAFVAGRLLAHPAPVEQTVAFDRAVLRARDRGRRAKELVKTRLDAQPLPDVAMLLEMARSRTPRDADWAMGQLAKLALDGVEIPGFTLDGVAGG